MASALTAKFTKSFRRGPTVVADLEISDNSTRDRSEPPDIPVTILFGPSGAGKTTILRALCGLERPDNGLIRVGNQIWFDSEHKINLTPQQRKAGLLFQQYALFPHMTVERNIAYGIRDMAHKEQTSRVNQLLEMMGIAHLSKRKPGTLSGGEAQRVALARALAPRPKLLLLDEPLSALDTPNRTSLRTQLRSTLKALGIPAIVVTHDRSEALSIGDEMAVVVGGRIVQRGPVRTIFSHPNSIEVANITGIETVIEATVKTVRGGLVEIEAHGRRLYVLSDDQLNSGDEVFACIRAEDVILEAQKPQLTSARNCLDGSIVAIADEGPATRVNLDCGFELGALVTNDAMNELNLRLNNTVTAVIKASAIHLIKR